jgi:hypothetical protein
MIAHHMAVEIFGREYAPHTPLEHVCVFAAMGLVLGLAVYGAYALAVKLMGLSSRRQRV